MQLRWLSSGRGYQHLLSKVFLLQTCPTMALSSGEARSRNLLSHATPDLFVHNSRLLHDWNTSQPQRHHFLISKRFNYWSWKNNSVDPSLRLLRVQQERGRDFESPQQVTFLLYFALSCPCLSLKICTHGISLNYNQLSKGQGITFFFVLCCLFSLWEKIVGC